MLKYIDVMARPMVMSQKREVMWTSVYADMAVRRKKHQLILIELYVNVNNYASITGSGRVRMAME